MDECDKYNIMKIYELLNETGKIPPKQMRDDLGGIIKIDPDPDKADMNSKFSISYINHDIAKFYNINPRILSYDRYGHRGVSEPHLHIFQKLKNKSDGYLDAPKDLPFLAAYDIFNGLYEQIIKQYQRDINERNKN